MAAKKFYAVKKGKTTGIFSNWADCKASVDGYSGAEYKGFATLAEAREYMGDEGADLQGNNGVTDEGSSQNKSKKMQGNTDEAGIRKSDHCKCDYRESASQKSDLPAENTLLAYVDGSYDDSIKKYAFGCVFLLADGRIYTEFGNGDNPQSLQHRNVTGEMLGSMYAVKFAMLNGFKAVEIRYDYEGIEKWVTGEWRSKTELTQKYAAAMRDWSKSIAISFTKVAAHTNVKYNEMADRLAKKGLVEGNGVPKVRKLEEYGTDSFK